MRRAVLILSLAVTILCGCAAPQPAPDDKPPEQGAWRMALTPFPGAEPGAFALLVEPGPACTITGSLEYRVDAQPLSSFSMMRLDHPANGSSGSFGAYHGATAMATIGAAEREASTRDTNGGSEGWTVTWDIKIPAGASAIILFAERLPGPGTLAWKCSEEPQYRVVHSDGFLMFTDESIEAEERVHVCAEVGCTVGVHSSSGGGSCLSASGPGWLGFVDFAQGDTGYVDLDGPTPWHHDLEDSALVALPVAAGEYALTVELLQAGLSTGPLRFFGLFMTDGELVQGCS